MASLPLLKKTLLLKTFSGFMFFLKFYVNRVKVWFPDGALSLGASGVFQSLTERSAHPHPAFCRHLCAAVSATPSPWPGFRVPDPQGPPRDAGRDIIPGILPIVRPR